MASLTHLLKKIASLKVIGGFFLLYLLSFTFISSNTIGTARLKEITGGVSIPDVEMMGYSPQRLYNILTSQGEAGRAFYLRTIQPQDIPLPFFYSMFFATFLTFLAQRLFPANHPVQHIGLLGLCNALMDWAENACFATLVLNYPQRLDPLAMTANMFTILKTTLALINLGLIVTGLVWLVAKKIMTKAPTKRTTPG